MSRAPLTRSAAVKAALAAKIGLFVLAPCAVAGVILALPAIPTPHYDPPDLNPVVAGSQAGPAVRPVNHASIARVLNVAGAFPPPPAVPAPANGGSQRPVPPPASATGPEVRFLGAIVEPTRFVALLSIDGTQKFLGPGEMFRRVRVVDCSASEVMVEIEGVGGRAATRRTIAVATRDGPSWTEGTIPEPAAETPGGEPGIPPGMAPDWPNPANFPTVPGFTPQQIEQMRREAEGRMRTLQGDGSQ